MTFKAEMTWGMGPDVSLILSDGTFLLYENPINLGRLKHGSVASGSADLTASEAIELGRSLIVAGNQATEIEQQCRDHDNKHSPEDRQ